MPYISLYRKYRSQTFSDLVGQNHVVRTLQNGITSGKIAHAYLFTGPRGTGKTSTARLLAKALCCEKGPAAEPCNECSVCVSITEGACLDVYEMDAASEAGVDQVREAIVQAAEYKPSACRYKVFIIDEVHDLSAKAFDALLKTVEEPPEHVIFILATTEYNKVPPTIRSRCQKHEFHRGGLSDLVSRLEHVAKGEGLEIDAAALSAIARMADGGYRDALTILEQVIVTSTGKVTVQDIYDQLGLIADEVVDQMLVAMREGDVANLTRLVSEIGRMGRDPRAILESMLYRLSDMTRVAYGVEMSVASEPTRDAALHETCTRIGNAQMLRMRSALAEAHKTIRDISLPRLWLEAELVRVSQILNAPARAAVAPAEERRVVREPEPAAPRAVEPHAQRKPEPEASKPEPKSDAPPERKPQPAPEPEPEPTGDPDLDRARTAWAKAKAEMAAVSNLMKVKLADTKVVGLEDGKIHIEFRRQGEMEWVTATPKRQVGVRDALQRAAGELWEPVYSVAKREKPVSTDAHTVELPSEGQKLVNMARDVFGAQN